MMYIDSTPKAPASPSNVVRFKNNLYIRGKDRGIYFSSGIIEGITWEFVQNYFIKFNNQYAERPAGTVANHIVGNSSALTDDIKFFGNVKDTTRADWYDAKHFGAEEIDNGADDDVLSNPIYSLSGIDYDLYRGVFNDSFADNNTNFVTWTINQVVSVFTDAVGTRFYKAVQSHTSIITSDPVVDTADWVNLTWDLAGVRSDAAGWASGDTQSNHPPDNFKLSTADFWNSLNMGLSFNADIITNTIFKWYYADDAAGTNKVLIAGFKEATFDINDTRNEWLALKTGKYIVGSVTPVDINGAIGAEVFATGIVI